MRHTAWALRVHRTHTAYAPHVHRMCTACAPHVHRMCTAYAPHVHRMCTSQGHSYRKNLSDATLWLDHFHYPGGTVLGVDLLEDYALDLQHR